MLTVLVGKMGNPLIGFPIQGPTFPTGDFSAFGFLKTDPRGGCCAVYGRAGTARLIGGELLVFGNAEALQKEKSLPVFWNDLKSGF